MTVRLLAIALAFATVSSPVFAASSPLPRAEPRSVGLSAEALRRIGETLKADVAAGKIPGGVVAVARKGKLVYFEAVGYRDAATKAPMRHDDIFSIASMTKPMTSVAAMMLHDEGKLFLSDPIGKHLAPMANMQVAVMRKDDSGKTIVETVPARRQPNIQDLLRHTSGITYGGRGETDVHKMWPASSSFSSTAYTGAEFIQHIGKLPLLYQPGTVWDYSLSTDVLGQVVEAISGKSLGAVLAERIWKPLGMVDTSFTVPAAKQDRYARALPNDPLTGKPQTVLHASGKPLKFECGGGCALSTAGDSIRFAQMLLNGGTFEGKRLLAKKTVEMMTADQLGAEVRGRTTSPVLSEGYSFGLGFAVRTQTGIATLAGSAGDYNWGGAFGTYFWVDPKEKLAVVFMAAAPGDIRVHYRNLVKNLVLQSITD